VKIIDAYIAKSVLWSMRGVLAIFGSLDFIFALISTLEEPASGFWQALQYVGMTMPRHFYDLAPYVSFIGALVGLGSLAGSNEIIAFRMAGTSVFRLFGAVSLPASVALIIAFLIGEFIAPNSEEAAEAFKARVRQGSDVTYLEGGHWYREGSLFMNAQAIVDDGTLINVEQFRLGDEGQLTLTRHASSGRFLGDSKGWQLDDVTETRFVDDRAETREARAVVWASEANPKLLSVQALVEPRSLSLFDLVGQIAYMRREALSAASYELALWSKAMQPVAILGLTLLALGFILGPLRQVSMGSRLTVGVLAGLGFKYLQDFFGPMTIVYGLPAWLAVGLPVIVCWIVGLWGLRREG
jgi:lipopolysaccharide export system permease protein